MIAARARAAKLWRDLRTPMTAQDKAAALRAAWPAFVVAVAGGFVMARLGFSWLPGELASAAAVLAWRIRRMSR